MKVTTKPPSKNTTATTTRAPTSRTSTSSKGPDRSLLTLPVSDIARTGIAGGISKLPFLERIQASFGPAHDLSTVSAHVDDRAANASRALGARAYALGDHVAFATTPTLHLAAHEAAHVVQQRGTRAGDDERLARMVADRVIGGRAAEDLLPSPLRSRVGHPLVQRDVDPLSAAELRDDAGQVATETPSPVLHRKPATKPAASETKPQIIAIEAVMDAKQGTAALSDRTTVPLTLSKNDYPPGTRVLNHESNGKYAGAAPIIDPKNPKRSTWAFVWINPYLPGTKEVSYAWAPSVTVTIRLTAEQRVGRLPAYIRNALTTDKGEKAGADEIEEVAHAGELLEQAGVTAQDMILYDEQIKAARASGATISQVDAFDFAQSMVGVRAQKQLQSVQQFDDVITISKLLADEPLYTLGHGGLGPTLDPDSDKIELSVAFGIYKAYAQQGRAGDLGTLDTAGKKKYLHELVVGFRTLLRRFEQALLVDLRALADTALDAAEASILLMDKRFTGIWQEIVPGPGFLHDEIDRINQSEPIVRATDQRVEDNAAIDRETFIDKKKLHQEYFGPSLKAVADYAEREEQRDERRKQVEAAFEEAVRKSSDLKLPPGKSARQILEANNSDSAVTLLRDYLYDGRSKIRAARSKISEDKVLYAAEIWIHAEQEHLKAALGAELGGEIAVLIDRFASLRKSQTSIWEDLLRIIEFVSMFVPGPIGWGLRAGTAILSANEELSQQFCAERDLRGWR